MWKRWKDKREQNFRKISSILIEDPALEFTSQKQKNSVI